MSKAEFLMLRDEWTRENLPFHEATDKAMLPNLAAFEAVERDLKPPNYSELTGEEQEEIYEARALKPGRFVWGATGTGKTRAAWTWLMKYSSPCCDCSFENSPTYEKQGDKWITVGHEISSSLGYEECSPLFRELAQSARSRDAFDEVFRRLETPDYLVLDDLGHKLTEAGAANLLDILKARHEKADSKRTCITSQFSLPELLDLWRGSKTIEAIGRRLKEWFVPVCFNPVPCVAPAGKDDRAPVPAPPHFEARSRAAEPTGHEADALLARDAEKESGENQERKALDA